MVVSSQTAYVSGGFCLVVDRGQVLRHYLGGWFVCDLVSTFPWDSLVSECTSVKKPVLQLLSLVRVLRVLRAPRIIHRITHDWAIHSVKIGFFLYMIFTLLVAHVMGCLFFLCPVVFKSGGGGRESWREKNGVDDMRPPKQYVYSIYWAFTTMTTLGYGDIVPSLLPELVLTILAEIVGAAAFALLVLHIQKLYDVILMEDVSSVAQRNQLTTYLDQMKVHKGLKTKIMRYISYAAHMHTYSSFDDDDPRFLGLTKALKLELRVEIFRPILLRNPIFNRVPGAAIAAVARQVLSRPCSPGETFIDPGAYGDCVYIVLAGKVKVLDGTGAEFKVLRWSDVNNVVAITALLDDEIQASLAPLTEKLTAQACDHCSLAYIPRDAFRKGVLPVWPQGDTVLLEMLAEQAGVDQGRKRVSKAPLSTVFHSCRLIFGRATIPRSVLEAWMFFCWNARARNTRVESTLHHPFPAQASRACPGARRSGSAACRRRCARPSGSRASSSASAASRPCRAAPRP